MKKLVLTILLAFVAMPVIAAEGTDVKAESWLKPIEAKYVCMVNDTAFDKEQIVVEADGKTYYGCCMGCVTRLKNDMAIRTAVDPVSGEEVDKASAVIGAAANDRVYYFENEENLKKYAEGPMPEMDKKMGGMDMKGGMDDMGMMKDGMMMSPEEMQSMHKNMMGSDKAEQVEGIGVINEIMHDQKKVNITHEPMEALGWPEMTMDFLVSADIETGELQEGMKVNFTIRKTDSGMYEITDIQPTK